MTLSLRDQRVRIYGYTNQPGSDSGFVNPKYVVLPSADPDQAWWCRLQETIGRELTVAEAAEHQSNCEIYVSDEVAVPLNGVALLLLPDGNPGPLYRISDVHALRIIGELQISAVFADKSLYTLVD